MTSDAVTSYSAAGVDVAAGERAVELMKAAVKRTARPESLGGLGGFAGLFQLDLTRYPQPVLASSTDGVAPKTPWRNMSVNWWSRCCSLRPANA